MAKVSVKPYLSPTLVLLAFDWPDGSQRKDFLGFAIRREPGFDGKPFSFLPNRLTFDGPVPSGEDVPSDKAPIQKFMWWDARIDVGGQRNFTYTVIPVTGAEQDLDHLSQVTDAAASVPVVCPSHIQDGIGTWFNRAVVSSQAFTKLLTSLGVSKPADVTPEKNLKLRTWLANGMETVVPQFIANSDSVAGAIYHLTDGLWIIPEMQESPAGKVDIVYDSHLLRDPNTKKMKPSPNQTAVDTLTPRVTFHARDKTQIMHNKFLAAPADKTASRVLAGSANFTTEGLTSQANLVHTFENAPELAQAYFTRQTFLRNNPSLTDTRAQAAWSETWSVGTAQVRVFFSPEPQADRSAMSEITKAINGVSSSVMFCLYDPTDKELVDACFSAGDKGKVLFGLLNNIKMPVESPHTPAQQAGVEVYTRSKEKKDVVPAGAWDKTTPIGFFQELRMYPGERPPAPGAPPVTIHHKFIIIDAETDTPTIYTGSANMSDASQHSNDENLLEIKGDKKLAAVYMSEFLRLYEHYRARATIDVDNTLKLATTSEWADLAFKPDTPEYKARLAFCKDERSSA